MCTGKFQFRKPGAVEQNQRTEKFGRPPPVFFRTSILPYDQQGAQETSKRETAEIQGGFCFEGTKEGWQEQVHLLCEAHAPRRTGPHQEEQEDDDFEDTKVPKSKVLLSKE